MRVFEKCYVVENELVVWSAYKAQACFVKVCTSVKHCVHGNSFLLSVLWYEKSPVLLGLFVVLIFRR